MKIQSPKLMNLKIVFSILIAFIVVSFLLIVFLDSFPDTTQYREREFFSQNFDPKINKIFIIGSSYVGELNTTLINQDVSNYYKDYSVYNLAYATDTPAERSKTLQDIILLKPRIIIYGISYRDFQSDISQETLLPDPHKSFIKLFSFYNLEKFNFPNPQLVTQTVLRELQNGHGFSSKDEIWISNTPFFPYHITDRRIMSDKELQDDGKRSNTPDIYIDPTSENQQVKTFKKIIEEFHKNNIKVIVFAAPHHKVYLDSLPYSQKEIFNSILQDLKNRLDIKIYDLTDKYANLAIWANINHVAYNKNSSIYSEDVTKIILNEIGS